MGEQAALFRLVLEDRARAARKLHAQHIPSLVPSNRALLVVLDERTAKVYSDAIAELDAALAASELGL